MYINQISREGRCVFSFLINVFADDVAVVEADGALTVGGNVGVVGNDYDGGAFFVYLSEKIHYALAGLFVKRARGFVCEKN